MTLMSISGGRCQLGVDAAIHGMLLGFLAVTGLLPSAAVISMSRRASEKIKALADMIVNLRIFIQSASAQGLDVVDVESGFEVEGSVICV